MKRVFIAAGIFFTMGVIYFIVEKVMGLTEQAPKTQKELLDIADTKYYRKEGEPFEIDSIQFIVKGFTILKEQDSVTLLIDVSMQNKIASDTSLESSFFVLKDEADHIFLPQPGHIDVDEQVSSVSIRYSLPEMNIGYFLYRLHLNSPSKPEQKSIVPIYKNYRSEG